MPYFLILPLFAILVGLLSLGVLLAALVPSLRHWLPLAWRLLLWCPLGFLLGNLVILLVMLALGQLLFPAAEGSWMQAPAGLLGGCVIFVGPFVVSAAGVFGGAALALGGARKAGRA